MSSFSRRVRDTQMKRIDMFKLECCLSDCDGVPPWFNQKIDGFDAVPGIVEEQPWLQPGCVILSLAVPSLVPSNLT